MKPDKLTIDELFQRDRRYVVPLYQRPYVWTRERQWEFFWDDIERSTEACLEADLPGQQRSHFLGAIVLNVSRIVGKGVARSEIIDGQQRLTTLQIVIAAIRDLAASIGSEHVARLRGLTVNQYEKSASDGAFKVCSTNADREIFRLVLSAGSPDSLKKALGNIGNTQRGISAAYLYFYDRVQAFVNGSTNDFASREHRLFGLIQALRTSLQLVVIELEDSDDPQVIFETLNARGQPLLPSDLIRNYVFMQAGEAADESDDLYDRYWRSFDDYRAELPTNGEYRFWHIEERQGRLTRPRIDLFLFHYLVMKTERDLNIGELFRQFREWHQNSGMTIEDLLLDLQFFGVIFARIVDPIGQERGAVFARRLKALDNSTIFPLVLYIQSLPEERLSTGMREQILDDLESWLVRRFVCQLTNKNYNRFFVSILAKLKHSSFHDDLAGVVRSELNRSSEITTVWPTGAEFRNAWLSYPICSKSRPDRITMLLRAIETRIRTSKNEAITVPDTLSIEHLLPQKGSLADYPLGEDIPTLEGEAPERARERLLHTIGNLTLLTNELNSSVSNGPFAQKVAKIVADSDLRLYAWLRLPTAPSSWSEQSIINRGKELFEYAVLIWGRPSIDPDNIDDEPIAAKKGVWQFTDSSVLQKKRETLLVAFSSREAVALSPVSIAMHQSADGMTRAVVAISKRYTERQAVPYWYGYSQEWDNFLSIAKDGYLILGCVDRHEGYAVPRAIMHAQLPLLNQTIRAATNKYYWHIHLIEREGKLSLLLPKNQSMLDLAPYVIN